jgi:hypothetical protein
MVANEINIFLLRGQNLIVKPIFMVPSHYTMLMILVVGVRFEDQHELIIVISTVMTVYTEKRIEILRNNDNEGS